MNGDVLSATPGIPSESLVDAQLFADRLDAMAALPVGGTIAEVGVGFGDFSVELVRRLKPRKFVGIDRFGLEQLDNLWGRPMAEHIGTKTHERFYRDRMEALSMETRAVIEVRRGESWDELNNMNERLDMAYIDAGHALEDVQRDAVAAAGRLAPGGVLVFNDYCWRDAYTGDLFGVVNVVNRLLAEGGWNVRYLALHPQMFCDIAIARAA